MTENTQQQQPEKRSIKTDTSPFLIAVLVAAVAYVHWSSMRFALFVLVAGLIIAFAYTAGLFNGIYDDVPGWFSRLIHGFKRQPKTDKLTGDIYDVFLGHDDESGAAVIENILEMDCAGVYGLRGGGKTSLLHTILHGIIVNHSPDEIKVVIADLKEGLDFRIYRQLRHLLWPVASSADEALLLVRGLDDELKRRGKLFKAIPKHRLCNSLNDYHRINDELNLGLPHLPLVFAIIDEFQILTDQSQEALNGLISLAKTGRAFGIIVVLATQLPNVDALPQALKSQFSTKFVGYMSNPSNYYKIAEVGQELWKPFHERGKVPGLFIASIAGRTFILRVFRIPPRELEAVAMAHSLPIVPKMPQVETKEVEPIKRAWKGSADQKRAMLVEWFQHFNEMPTEAQFTDEFDASKRTYYDWVAKVWNEVN